jgi:hypothetical protein
MEMKRIYFIVLIVIFFCSVLFALGSNSTIPTYQECVLEFAKKISKEYRLNVSWTGKGDRFYLDWRMHKKSYIEMEGTPDSIFEFIDKQTLEDNNYLQKYKEECENYR